MKINIIGAGYVGLTCCAFLSKNNEITFSDINKEKIYQLKHKKFKCSEPYLLDIINSNIHISFQSNYSSNQDIYMVCVGTPNKETIPDLSQIKSIINELKQCLSSNSIIILKSTILPGTTKIFKDLMGTNNPVYFIPEFLSEGNAFNDYVNAEKIIIGAEQADKENLLLKEFLLLHSCNEIHFTDYATAELTKYANNIMLASRIATINQIALIADKVGAKMLSVEHFIGLDSRIGAKYLKSGMGFGGSCLEKDLIALNNLYEQSSYTSMFSSIIKNNHYQPQYFANKINSILNADIKKKIVISGLTFKNNTDDCRNSMAAHLLSHLIEFGYKVGLHDCILKKEGILSKFIPEFKLINNMKNNPTLNNEQIHVIDDEELFINYFDALVVCQKHENTNYEQLQSNLNKIHIFDPNKYLEKIKFTQAGAQYHSIEN